MIHLESNFLRIKMRRLMKNLYQQTLDSNSFGDKSDGRLIQVELVIEMRWRHLGQVPNPKNEIFAKNSESDTITTLNKTNLGHKSGTKSTFVSI